MSVIRLWLLVFLWLLPFGALCQETQAAPLSNAALQKRWLFVWRNLNDPREVDRMLERFPRAAAAGCNGVVFSSGIPAAKASGIRQAAESNHLDLIAIV